MAISKLVAFIGVFFLATASFAAEISEFDVKIFLNNWLAAQNKGSYPDYAAMYSKSFVGIRRSGTNARELNYNAWLKDRKNMFKNKMLVKTVNPEVEISGATATVKFEQIWESGTYKDKGDKLLYLELENKQIKIVREVMLSSEIIGTTKKQKRKVGVAVKKDDVVEIINPSTSKNYFQITSIREMDCRKVSNRMSAYFDNRKLDRRECSAPSGWRLFTVVGGEYYWLEIAYSGLVWSTESEVVTKGENRFGNFQSIDFEQVEWKVSAKGDVEALIFPVVAQDSERIEQNIYRFFIIKFTDKIPCFAGVAKTINEARAVVDKLPVCISALPEKRVSILLIR